jgi:hypothetical protein
MSRARSQLEAALWIVLLAVPLVIGLVWGTLFDDGAWVTFRCARNLVAGRGLAHNLMAEAHSLPGACLYVLALALLARLGIPLLWAGLVLSALGWGATAIAIYCVGRAMHRPVAAVASAALLVFSPIVVSTLATEASWTVALAWIAVATSLGKRWNAQACALILMLCVHFDLGTAALAALLLVAQWAERRRFPLQLGLLLAIVALGWGLIAAVYHLPIAPRVSFDAGYWALAARRLEVESPFYWFYLPFLLCGSAELFITRRWALWGGLLWAAVAVLSGDPVAGATLVALGVFLAGLGLGRVITWVETRNVFRLERIALTVSLVLVAGAPLGVAQVSSLVQRYSFRPIIRRAVEQLVGDWLHTHSEPTATVFSSERVGYFADRPTVVWDGSDSDRAILTNLLRALNEDPPEYCVSFKSIGWEHLMRTEWFRDGYAPLKTFRSPYDAASSFTIWRYRFSRFDLGERRPLDVHLPGGVDLVGYRYGPDRIEPGGAVYATLFLRATQLITDSFRIVTGVISPRDGVGWAQRDMTISHESDLVGWWQTGQAIAERFVLTTTADIPVGAYRLKVAVAQARSAELLPMYQDDDVSPLDQIVLGDVVVPWQGEPDFDEPVGADFGGQISLLGFDAKDHLSPGAEFDVSLYWEALRPPDDDYVVFVHLLDTEGQIVAAHDGPPMDGRYATGAWLPGEVVPDVHRLALGPGAPTGVYRLQVGVYQWPSMDRLPVWDGQGVEQAERAIVLQSVTVEAP